MKENLPSDCSNFAKTLIARVYLTKKLNHKTHLLWD